MTKNTINAISDGPSNDWSPKVYANAIDVTTANTVSFGASTRGGGRFYPTMIGLSVNTLSGTLLTQPIFSVGTNSSSYDNILSTTLLTTLTALLSGFNAVNKMCWVPISWVIDSVADNTEVYFKVNTVATGLSLTYTMNVTLWGFYF